jgi:uncharacterized protein YcbK (DUF882 family)
MAFQIKQMESVNAGKPKEQFVSDTVVRAQQAQPGQNQNATGQMQLITTLLTQALQQNESSVGLKNGNKQLAMIYDLAQLIMSNCMTSSTPADPVLIQQIQQLSENLKSRDKIGNQQ